MVTRAATKALLVPLLPLLFRCAPAWLRKAWQPPVCVDYSGISSRLRSKVAAVHGHGWGSEAVSVSAQGLSEGSDGEPSAKSRAGSGSRGNVAELGST